MIEIFHLGKDFLWQKLPGKKNHPDWESKQWETKQTFKTSNRAQFLQSLASGSFQDYKRLTTIDIYHDGLAIARLDLPENTQTTFLVLYKVDKQWYIVSERSIYHTHS